jgi:hypothetical protein
MYFDFSKDGFIMGTSYSSKKKTDDYIFSSILDKLNLNKKLVVSTNQVHGNKIKHVINSGTYDSYDGLIAESESKLILLIKTADCVPIFIYDNNKKIYSLIHAGWRGVQKKIHTVAIKKFFDFNSKLNDLYIVLGPSIKECCFEIKEDVAKMFDEKFILIDNNRSYLNLNKSIISDLKKMGIKNIQSNQICSYDDDRCHSYRKDGLLSGRMYSFITY